MDLGLTFSVDTDNFGAYEEIEVFQTVFLDPYSCLAPCSTIVVFACLIGIEVKQPAF